MDGRAYIRQLFAWSAEARADAPAMLAAGLGMAGPIVLMAGLGHARLGLAATLGGLLISRAATGRCVREQARNLAEILAAALAAALCSVLIAGHPPWTAAGMTLLAGVAAVIGGYSRPLALGTGRFVVFLAITADAADGVQNKAVLLLLIVAGALWLSGLALALGSLLRLWGWCPGLAPAPGRVSTAGQKWRRWRQSLRQVAGWHYALRLTASLAPAAVLQAEWPGHHLGWVGLTIAILTQRRVEHPPFKLAQRAIGASLGVAVTGLLAPTAFPLWFLTLLVATLGGLGPWLRARNYLAYTASMTPLIILLSAAGGLAEPGILADRLVATAIGAGLVALTNNLSQSLRK